MLGTGADQLSLLYRWRLVITIEARLPTLKLQAAQHSNVII
jgi:hypothetical protein